MRQGTNRRVLGWDVCETYCRLYYQWRQVHFLYTGKASATARYRYRPDISIH
jgi:hypothetical protein